jgi:mono/diheme cytochrome c family protein
MAPTVEARRCKGLQRREAGAALSGSSRVAGHRDYVIKVLLHGLTGEVDGKAYGTGVMVPMGANTDQWVADVASYCRSGK